MKWLGRSIHQSYFVVAMCVGIVVGAILALAFRTNYFASPIWIGFAVAVMVLAYFWPRVAFVVVALIAGMILVFVRCSNELTGEDYVGQFYGQNVVVTGTINGDPETDENTTKFKLNELRFGENEEYATNGSVYVSEYKNEKLAWGDKVTLEGKMVEGFGTYVGYMYKPEIKKWEKPEPGNWVIRVRNWFAERIERLVPEPQVKLGLSYLLGMKSGLPDDLDGNLRTVGLVHIVVASGAHLAILVEIARRIFGKLSRFAGLFFSVLFVIFFMAMVGWTPSIMRAGIMTILTIVAWYVGRKFAPWRIILLVAAGTLLINPMFIVNLGWLLSFASFAGIMVLGPRFTKFCYGEKKPGFVMETVITTLAATAMTLPIILYYYGTVSLISVLANLLILPTLPFAMGATFAAGVVAGIPGIETAVGFVATKLLDFHIAVVEMFGGMKSFVVEIDRYQTWVFSIYILIFGLLVVQKVRIITKRKRAVVDIRKIFLWVAVWILVGEFVLGAILILSDGWNASFGKVQATFLCAALALFVGVNNFIRMEKGTKVVQGLALVSLISNIVWLLLATLMIWEVMPILSYGGTYHLSAAFKIMTIAVSAAAAGFWVSNIMVIKETVGAVKPLKITSIVCQIYCCVFYVLMVLTDFNMFGSDSGRWLALAGLADVAFFVTALAAWIISRASSKEDKSVSAVDTSAALAQKTDDQLRAEIEEKVRREMMEKEVRAKVEAEMAAKKDDAKEESEPLDGVIEGSKDEE